VIGDYDDLVGLIEDLGGQFAPDYAGENCWHGGKYGPEPRTQLLFSYYASPCQSITEQLN
jgi:hypothetical protein